jgi:MFS transporter, DHA2 family, multidrug resistance protein
MTGKPGREAGATTNLRVIHPVPCAHWLGFIAMCVGMFLAILDIQIVASSLPEIQTALTIPLDQLSWVQTAYLIAEVVAIPLTSRLTRLLTLGGLFAAAITGFVAASLGCGLSGDFIELVFFRVLQGFCGGALIPAVFTSVFVLFPERRRVLATTIAGLFAVLAPTVGPSIGGYITENYTWHWLFFANIGPGIAIAAVATRFIRVGRADWSLFRCLDYAGLFYLSLFLASLEACLKQGPILGWSTNLPVLLAIASVASGAMAIRRCLATPEPVIRLQLFRQTWFAIAAGYSFVLGAGLFGSVYMLPLFLGIVRQHTPLEIGEIMIVSGAAQLVVAPIAAVAEKRLNSRLLIAAGYTLFAGGLFANGFATIETDFNGLLWPQLLRGSGVMLCLLPTTRLALDGRYGDALTDASALFNLMRNLGGAIGIALIDTVLEERVPVHAAALVSRLRAGDAAAARLVGLPMDQFLNTPIGAVDVATREIVARLVERAAFALSCNEAWIMLGIILVLSLLALPWLRCSCGAPRRA